MPAGSTAARPLAPASQRWHRRCQEATTTLPAALRSGGSGSSAAHIAQLRTLWRCPAGSAVCIVAPPAASRPHWRCIRAAPEPAAPRGSASDHVAVPTRSAGPKSRENRGTSAAARAAPRCKGRRLWTGRGRHPRACKLARGGPPVRGPRCGQARPPCCISCLSGCGGVATSGVVAAKALLLRKTCGTKNPGSAAPCEPT